MKTPPPWVGGQIGYGETNSTRSGSACGGSGTNTSRKQPPRGLRNASVSEIVANLRALIRDATARGSWSVALAMPEKFARSGESPNSQLSIAFAQVNQKCACNRRHVWMFFHVNSR